MVLERFIALALESVACCSLKCSVDSGQDRQLISTEKVETGKKSGFIQLGEDRILLVILPSHIFSFSSTKTGCSFFFTAPNLNVNGLQCCTKLDRSLTDC